MNPTLAQLARRAGITVSAELEKFAELIVRKCAEIADVERPSSLGCGYITKTKGMLIKEHFGVKE